VANPEDPKMRHISVAGGTYTILVTGAETGGRYCLIDMLVPPGGAPPPHRHDFEEMFTILDGAIELTFRGEAWRWRDPRRRRPISPAWTSLRATHETSRPLRGRSRGAPA
jgi:hypothetical protein